MESPHHPRAIEEHEQQLGVASEVVSLLEGFHHIEYSIDTKIHS